MVDKLRNEFVVRDHLGEERTVYEYVEMVPAGTLGDPDAVEEGLGYFIDDNGDHVNRNEDGTFTVVKTNETLTPQ